MRINSNQGMISQRIQQLLGQGDRVGAAAFAFRYRGVCPICRGAISWSAEDAVSSRRMFTCRSCRWNGVVTEVQFRGDPAITLRNVVESAERAGAARQAAARRASEDMARTATTRRLDPLPRIGPIIAAPKEGRDAEEA